MLYKSPQQATMMDLKLGRRVLKSSGSSLGTEIFQFGLGKAEKTRLKIFSLDFHFNSHSQKLDSLGMDPLDCKSSF